MPMEGRNEAEPGQAGSSGSDQRTGERWYDGPRQNHGRLLAGGWGSPQNEGITKRTAADSEWLERHGVYLTKWGPDAASGKVKVFLTDYSDAARDLLLERYGDAILVAPGSWPRPTRCRSLS